MSFKDFFGYVKIFSDTRYTILFYHFFIISTPRGLIKFTHKEDEYIGGLVEDCSNPNALAIDLL